MLARLHVCVCFCYACRTRYSLDDVQVFRVVEAAVWSLLVFFSCIYILVPHFRLRFKSENCVCRLRFCMPPALKSTTILPTICLSILKEKRSPLLKHNILLCQQTNGLLPKKRQLCENILDLFAHVTVPVSCIFSLVQNLSKRFPFIC